MINGITHAARGLAMLAALSLVASCSNSTPSHLASEPPRHAERPLAAPCISTPSHLAPAPPRHVDRSAPPLAASCSGSTLPAERASVVVRLDEQDVDTPPSKDKFCRYSSKMITSCEFQITLRKFSGPSDGAADAGKAYSASRNRELARMKTCVSRTMTVREARDGWSCLEWLSDCSELPRCVGEDYEGHPADKLRLELVEPTRRRPTFRPVELE